MLWNVVTFLLSFGMLCLDLLDWVHLVGAHAEDVDVLLTHLLFKYQYFTVK